MTWNTVLVSSQDSSWMKWDFMAVQKPSLATCWAERISKEWSWYCLQENGVKHLQIKPSKPEILANWKNRNPIQSRVFGINGGMPSVVTLGSNEYLSSNIAWSLKQARVSFGQLRKSEKKPSTQRLAVDQPKAFSRFLAFSWGKQLIQKPILQIVYTSGTVFISILGNVTCHRDSVQITLKVFF